MTATDTTKESTTRVSVIPPFGIEANHPRNCDILIQCIPNCRLRSSIDGQRGAMDDNGNYRVPRGQAEYLSSFPKTPGMQLIVYPAECRYVIRDPLRDNHQMLDRIQRFLKEKSISGFSDKLNGIPTTEGKLDVHRMKTLCRELIQIVNNDYATVCEGRLPDLEDLDELPGHFMLNPGSRIPNTQPVYEHQFDQWLANLSQTGG